MAAFSRSNPKAFDTLNLKLNQLSQVEGKTGWFSSAKYEDGTQVAYAAALNELGHGNTPPRPFMRPAEIEHRKEWADIAARGAKAMLTSNTTATDVMKAVTLQAEDDVRDSILAVTAPALSPITIELRAMKKRNPSLIVTGSTVGEAARKVAQTGYQKPNVSDKPLVDSHLMIDTLTHTVEKK